MDITVDTVQTGDPFVKPWNLAKIQSWKYENPWFDLDNFPITLSDWQFQRCISEMSGHLDTHAS